MPPVLPPRSIVVAVSGASGAVYAERLLRWLLADADREVVDEVVVLITDPARLVIAHERGAAIPERAQEDAVRSWLGVGPEAPVRVAYQDDLMDRICSGSAAPDAMAVVPCSMAMLSGIACGRADDLAFRAADVMLKERRTLVLVPRETPLSLIHLRNMVAVAEAGAAVVPAMPGFYAGPSGIDDLVDHVVGKVLDQLGIQHRLFRRWGEVESFEGA